MRKSILLLEKELQHIQELMNKCQAKSKGCDLKCDTEKCQLLKDYNQLSRDIQTLYTGK